LYFVKKKKNLLDVSEVEKLCSVDWPNTEKIQACCKEFEFSSRLLIYNSTVMLNISVIEQRRILLDEGLDVMEENAVVFMDNARNFSKNPHDPNNVEFQKKTLEASKDYCKGLNKIIQASNITEDSPFRNFFAAIEYIQVLIVIAHKLFKTSNLFFKLVATQNRLWKDIENFVEVLEGYLNRTMDVIKNVMDKESEAAKRAFLESCIWELEDVYPVYHQTIKSVQFNRPDMRQRVADLNERIAHATRKIITGVDDGIYAGSAKMKLNLNAVALTSMDVMSTTELEVYKKEAFGTQVDIKDLEFSDANFDDYRFSVDFT